MGKVRPRAVMWLIITGESHREWALARLLGLDTALCPFLFSKSFLFSFLPVNTHTHIAFFSLCNACLSSVTHEGRTGKDLEDLISLRQNPRERRRGQLTAVTRETFYLPLCLLCSALENYNPKCFFPLEFQSHLVPKKERVCSSFTSGFAYSRTHIWL